MHLGLILDEERLQHEHGMFHAVRSQLEDQGHSVSCIVPESDEHLDAQRRRFPTDGARADLGDDVHEYPVRRTRRRRYAVLSELARTLDREPIDVLYAIGHNAWPVAFEFASICECPLMLDIWNAPLVKKVPRGRAPEALAALVASTPAIAAALRQRVDPNLVNVVPFGVELPTEPRTVLPDDDDMKSLAILCNCTDMKAYRATLNATRELLEASPNLQVFLELRGPHQHDVWRLAQKLDLLDRISSLNDGAMFRPLLRHCDVIAVPERLGRVRSLVYEAMAAGIPTVIGDDPWIDLKALEPHDQPAVRTSNRAENWIESLTSVLESPARARHIGAVGRDWIRCHHTVDRQVSDLLATAEGVLRGGAYAFPAST